ncbi:hypothetical protein ACQCSU_12550 [Pseudarthrobacter sp. O4]|uniref:hypothetical protein n=1 Tax=Pseudarthrobacter sp. O4 TaxID=3418417 RepID=UPI003CEFDC9A
MNRLEAACKSRGLLPFANFNCIHVVPPCNTSVENTKTGLAILDEVLDIADAYTPGPRIDGGTLTTIMKRVLCKRPSVAGLMHVRGVARSTPRKCLPATKSS